MGHSAALMGARAIVHRRIFCRVQHRELLLTGISTYKRLSWSNEVDSGGAVINLSVKQAHSLPALLLVLDLTPLSLPCTPLCWDISFFCILRPQGMPMLSPITDIPYIS
jgi:hypothetical protein